MKQNKTNPNNQPTNQPNNKPSKTTKKKKKNKQTTTTTTITTTKASQISRGVGLTREQDSENQKTLDEVHLD